MLALNIAYAYHTGPAWLVRHAHPLASGSLMENNIILTQERRWGC